MSFWNWTMRERKIVLYRNLFRQRIKSFSTTDGDETSQTWTRRKTHQESRDHDGEENRSTCAPKTFLLCALDTEKKAEALHTPRMQDLI